MVDFTALAGPFPPASVSWRVGSTTGDKKKGMALAFIDARDVMERLDAVCGPAGWQCSYPHANGKTVCSISIKVGDEWVSKADGAGDTDVEAEKGALSDAFKRAAVRWGIGRYLYDLPSPWVELEPAGRSFKIADHEMKRLAALLDKHQTPQPAISMFEVEAADRWIAEVRRCEAVNDLDALKRQAEFVSGVKALPPALRAKVQDAGKAHREKLIASSDLTMAG